MAWFRNYYKCARCGSKWTDEWSCMCDDDCPDCGARHMTPYDSADLSEFIEARGSEFVVLRSSDVAEHDPDYVEVAKFPTREQAETHLGSRRNLALLFGVALDSS
jgi:predicted  nucleic acid-binding Zn-ribbon protein